MHSDGGDFTGNRKKKKKKEEVIRALCILGCMWYLKVEDSIPRINTVCADCQKPPSMAPNSLRVQSAGPHASHSNSEMFPAASVPLLTRSKTVAKHTHKHSTHRNSPYDEVDGSSVPLLSDWPTQCGASFSMITSVLGDTSR